MRTSQQRNSVPSVSLQEVISVDAAALQAVLCKCLFKWGGFSGHVRKIWELQKERKRQTHTETCWHTYNSAARRQQRKPLSVAEVACGTTQSKGKGWKWRRGEGREGACMLVSAVVGLNWTSLTGWTKQRRYQHGEGAAERQWSSPASMPPREGVGRVKPSGLWSSHRHQLFVNMLYLYTVYVYVRVCACVVLTYISKLHQSNRGERGRRENDKCESSHHATPEIHSGIALTGPGA